MSRLRLRLRHRLLMLSQQVAAGAVPLAALLELLGAEDLVARWLAGQRPAW